MANELHTFDGNEVIATELPNLLNTNFNLIKSDFAGTSFPTSDLIEGMTCYRTDLKVVYRYIGGEWVKDIDLSNYVTLDGTQEISGAKKFIGNTTLVGNVYVPVSTTIQFFQNNSANLRGSLTFTNYTGNAASATKATNDSDGNKISTTYAKKSDTYTKTEVDNLIANSGGSNNLGYFTYSVSLETNIRTETFEAVDLSTLIQQVGVPKHITIVDRVSGGWDTFAIYACLTNSFDVDTMEYGDILIESSSVMTQYPTTVHLPIVFDMSTGKLYLVIYASSYNDLEITAYY